jgi:hypothetical protein
LTALAQFARDGVLESVVMLDIAVAALRPGAINGLLLVVRFHRYFGS